MSDPQSSPDVPTALAQLSAVIEEMRAIATVAEVAGRYSSGHDRFSAFRAQAEAKRTFRWVKTLEDLLASVPPEGASGWQPMETADSETPLLVSDRERGTVKAFRDKYGYWLSLPGKYPVRPTHWRELPTPPLSAPKEP